jgi:RHS repeat-associated protein
MLGNLAANRDAGGHITRYKYDIKGRLIVTTFPGEETVQCAYDGENNLIMLRDQNGHRTQFRYAGLGEMVERISADGGSVRYHYDSEERLVKVVNERRQTYILERDSLGRIIKEVDYWGSPCTFEYDAVGNVVKLTNAEGHATSYDYDESCRMIRKTDGDGVSEDYSYDGNGNLIAARNKDIAVSQAYDKEGNVVGEIQGDRRIESHFDAIGNRIERTVLDGRKLTYVRDAAGQVVECAIDDVPVAKFSYDYMGRIVAEQLGRRLRRSATYDANGRVLQQSVLSGTTLVAEHAYEYDRAGNLTKHVRSDSTTAFAYDECNRLREFTKAGVVQRIAYDAAGNVQADMPRDGEASSRRSGLGSVQYMYDLAGRLKRQIRGDRTETVLNWNAWDRLMGLTSTAGEDVVYAYDAIGRRVSKVTSGKHAKFLWDGDYLLEEYREGHAPREFVFRPESFEPFAVADDQIAFFQHDGIGVPHELISEQGEIIWAADYGPFGEAKRTKGLANPGANPIRFQGQYFDEESGFCYNRNRYFDPATGSFISQDPLGIVTGVNLYQYAPNVWAWIDPLGLSCRSIAEAKRAAGIPKSAQPKIQGTDRFGQRWWEFEVPSPGGGTERRVIVQHLPDSLHPFTHYHPGIPKPHSTHTTPPLWRSDPVKYYPLD